MAKVTYSQRWRFTGVGAGLSLAILLGLALTRGLMHGGVPSWELLRADVAAELGTYAYVGLSTLLAGVGLGWYIGGRAMQLELMSLTDPLTQLANRRGFGVVLQDELQRAARYHTPLALMLIDVDYLKIVNDAGGHEAGDAALRLVAESLRSTCRMTDLAARFGGDEFVVVAPSTTAAEAQELANRIRQTLGTLSHRRSDTGWLSLSIGIADLTACGCEQAEALLAVADAALYDAKEGGRNQVCLARRVMAESEGARACA